MTLDLLLMAAAITSGTALAAQPPQRDAFTRPTLTAAEPYSEVVALEELTDGRFLVADRREKLLYIVAADGRSHAVLGRNGQGPNEYVSAYGLTRVRGDTILLFGGNQRYQRVTPSGQLAGELSIPVLFLRAGSIAPPRGADARGALYWAGDIVGQTAAGFKRNQSQNIRRWTPPEERLDTVAQVADHAPAMHAHRFFPFAEHDAWVVASDGRVGVLSAAEYRLRWYRDGKLVSEGPSIAFTPEAVTPRDRVEFRLEKAKQPASGMSSPGASGSQGRPSAEAVRSMEEYYPDASFPATKPPFIENGALRSPRGEIWVTRSPALGAVRTLIDVLDESGVRRAQFELPPGRQLLALQRGGVYLVRIDEDGLQWIERYAWPPSRG